METAQPEPLDLEIVNEIAAGFRHELDRVHGQIEQATREHKRAIALRDIFAGDPLTRERFNLLHTNIDQYPGVVAGLREEERLLRRWLERCHDLLGEAKAA